MRGNRRNIRIRTVIFFLGALVLIGGILTKNNLSLSMLTAGEPKTSTHDSLASSQAKTTAVSKSLDGYKIVIDAGHGGNDPGAGGVSGKEEKEYTLALSREVYELLKLEPMFEPYMTRDDDSFVELDDRAKFANEREADAFISIHGNTYTDSSISGTETYYFSDNSRLLASTIHQELVEATGFNDRGVKHEAWRVLTQSEKPAILMEVGFLTNKEEEKKMLDPAARSRVAHAIVDGLKQYFTQTGDH
ncbi:N-acetylmuramoyl-L-alanine amidase family protein [Paenibacillus mendelii]|uniref:N-acetylmuramoyl-L-alanine amidase n=1 Tax=Paenibacillus mendelii TaxID=206163 RepID=A0ABV6J999_9BACL|nr:N-acetylmuramoyl-L-alanine amidase [Paenibacillus mendelii]MCQ6559784.1 N-acetylmuramoyl-L-alanine amidase [Paenibacillus mendelii]